jgi:hypothetical protein
LQGLVFNETNLCLYPSGKGTKDKGSGKGKKDQDSELTPGPCVDESFPLAVRP